MEYFIQGILSFIKVFEVFGDFLFHPKVLCILLTPDLKKEKKRPPSIGSLFQY